LRARERAGRSYQARGKTAHGASNTSFGGGWDEGRVLAAPLIRLFSCSRIGNVFSKLACFVRRLRKLKAAFRSALDQRPVFRSAPVPPRRLRPRLCDLISTSEIEHGAAHEDVALE